MHKIKIGIIGCGNISNTYIDTIKTCNTMELIACADKYIDKAKLKAKEYSIPLSCNTEELLKNKNIEIVVILTPPDTHYEICLSALNAGKHVYLEKPLSIKSKEGMHILNKAKEAKLRIGCAPDSFLGGGLKTCRKIINDGWIGRPIASTSFMACHGHENWHPEPDFFYKIGAGPLYDMGPYYITALVKILGPITGVCAMSKISFPERTITSKPKFGSKIKVETQTHYSISANFSDGTICNMIMSFDIWKHSLPFLEIYGDEGSLKLPDPNTYGGPIFFSRRGSENWSEIPLLYNQKERGIGLADMAEAIISGRQHHANGKLAYHVIDVICAIEESIKKEKQIAISSKCNI